MKKLLFLPLLLLLAAPLSAQKAEPVKPLYADKWGEVESYIKAHWLDYVETDTLLPKPYCYALNPGTLYYYDLYFINNAMLKHGLWEQCRNNLECFIYQIEQLGFVPTALRWGKNRSQMPLFSMMVRDYWERSPEKDTAFLARAYNAALREYRFWNNIDCEIENHRTTIPGLIRYSHHGTQEELVDFYDRVLWYRFHVPREVPVEVKLHMGGQRLAEAESMDFTPRYYGRCMDFIPVDLNANMYAYEKNFAYFEKELGLKMTDFDWETKAARRAELINRYLWNESRGLYLDYDFVNERHTEIACIMAFTTLCWGCVPEERKEPLKDNLFRVLEVQSGLTVCEPSDEPIPYQFGYRGIWGSMQYWAMYGLEQGGFHADAQRVATKYVNMVTKNYVDPYPAEYIPFKQTQKVKRPYGLLWEKFTNEGDINDNEYYCSPILGFTAAPYVLALEIIRKP